MEVGEGVEEAASLIFAHLRQFLHHSFHRFSINLSVLIFPPEEEPAARRRPLLRGCAQAVQLAHALRRLHLPDVPLRLPVQRPQPLPPVAADARDGGSLSSAPVGVKPVGWPRPSHSTSAQRPSSRLTSVLRVFDAAPNPWPARNTGCSRNTGSEPSEIPDPSKYGHRVEIFPSGADRQPAMTGGQHAMLNGKHAMMNGKPAMMNGKLAMMARPIPPDAGQSRASGEQAIVFQVPCLEDAGLEDAREEIMVYLSSRPSPFGPSRMPRAGSLPRFPVPPGPFLMLALAMAWAGPAALAVPPQVVLRAGHGAAVSQVLYSADGRTVASLGADRAVNLWDARTGARLAHWQPADVYPNQIAFAPVGGLLAVGGILGHGRQHGVRPHPAGRAHRRGPPHPPGHPRWPGRRDILRLVPRRHHAGRRAANRPGRALGRRHGGGPDDAPPPRRRGLRASPSRPAGR